MRKSLDAMKPTGPEDGRNGFRGGGPRRTAKACKKAGPSGHIVRQQENTEQQRHRHGRPDRRDEECVAEDSSGAGSKATVHSGPDDVVGLELVRQYYTVLCNAPEHVWRFYAEGAQYCDVSADGVRTVATGRPQLRELFGTAATADGGDLTAVVESVNTVRCASGQLLVMATSERFVQSFVVEFTPPRSFAVVASVVQHTYAARPPAPADADDRGGARHGHAAGGRQQSSNDLQLFVGHLTGATTAEHLRRTFSEYGEVVHVRIIGGHNRSGKPAKYNYAFVVFSGPEAVDAALASRPIQLCNGNRVNVHPSKGRRRHFPAEHGR